MITFYPTEEEFSNFRTPLQPGELAFLEKLKELFSESERHLHIFVQPNINGVHPDIVVMEENGYICIIEVKDWNYNSYEITSTGWIAKNAQKNYIPKSKTFPFIQVSEYKDDFYTLLCPELTIEKILSEGANYGLVKTAVYFHKSSKEQCEEIKKEEEECTGAKKQLDHIEYFGYDSKDSQYEDFFSLKKTKCKSLSKKEFEFFQRYLQPLGYCQRNNKKFKPSNEQKEIINSNQKKKKIKGIAGSGKTYVLVRKAVNFIENNRDKKVLILTYNLSLVNYLKDRLSELLNHRPKEDSFNVLNFHRFLTVEGKKYEYNFKINDSVEDFERDIYKFFNSIKDEIEKEYDFIFIDEAQDYTHKMLELIVECFLKEDGNFYAFLDSEQNIYEGTICQKSKIPTIPKILGRWSTLRENHRVISENLVTISNNFAKKFLFIKNVEGDEGKIMEAELPLFPITNDRNNIRYYNLNLNSSIPKVNEYLLKIYNFLIGENEHPNNIAFLSNTQEYLYEFDSFLREKTKEETTTTFVRKEVIEKLKNDFHEMELKKALKKFYKFLEYYKKDYKKNKEKIDKELLKKIFCEYKAKGIDEVRKERNQNGFYYDCIQFFDDNYIKKTVSKADKPLKFRFQANTSLVKISTIHSFKGWEIPNVVLIIVNNSLQKIPELIYTGLTRATKRLIVVNVDSMEIDSFFKENRKLINIVKE